MSHEQSETIQGRDNNWYNVYGRGTGATQPMPLPRLFSFEQPSYSTAEEAANKAAWRSHMGEGQYATTPPIYGFTPQARPEYSSLLGIILDALTTTYSSRGGNIQDSLFGPNYSPRLQSGLISPNDPNYDRMPQVNPGRNAHPGFMRDAQGQLKPYTAFGFSPQFDKMPYMKDRKHNEQTVYSY